MAGKDRVGWRQVSGAESLDQYSHVTTATLSVITVSLDFIPPQINVTLTCCSSNLSSLKCVFFEQYKEA